MYFMAVKMSDLTSLECSSNCYIPSWIINSRLCLRCGFHPLLPPEEKIPLVWLRRSRKSNFHMLPEETECKVMDVMDLTRLVQERVLWRDILNILMNTQDYWAFGLCPSSGILKNTKNTTFRKQNQFPKRCVSFVLFKIPDDAQSPKTQ
jgi:hypothetical protein